MRKTQDSSRYVKSHLSIIAIHSLSRTQLLIPFLPGKMATASQVLPFSANPLDESPLFKVYFILQKQYKPLQYDFGT